MAVLINLPNEVLIEILAKLPLKSLVICACTCKWLFFFITNPSFIVTQMKQNTQNPYFFFRYFTKSTHKNYFSLQLDDDTFMGEFNLVDMPLSCSKYDDECWLNVVGSCNGLICLSDNSFKCPFANNIILWNPLIRKRLVLPRHEMTFDRVDYSGVFEGFANDFSGDVRMGLGFGFDWLRNDFKVVRVVYLECHVSHKFIVPPIVDVYSVSSASWRAFQAPGPMYQICKPEYSQCFVNGAVHWPGWRDSFWSVIVTFNMQDEVFGEIEMPEPVANGCDRISMNLKVGNCRDMLALIIINAGSNSSSVWVMREYGVVESWHEIFRLDLPVAYPRPKALGFRKNEEILVFVADSSFHECRNLMLLVECNGHVVKVLGMIDGISSSFCLDTYVESLALLKEGKSVMEKNF